MRILREAVVEPLHVFVQERVLAEGNDDGLFLFGQQGGARFLRPGLQEGWPSPYLNRAPGHGGRQADATFLFGCVCQGDGIRQLDKRAIGPLRSPAGAAEAPPRGMCTTEKDKVNQDLLAFIGTQRGATSRLNANCVTTISS